MCRISDRMRSRSRRPRTRIFERREIGPGGSRMKTGKLLERTAALFALFLAGAGSLPAAGADAAPPNFAPNSIGGWIAVPGGFKAPPSGPGPIVNDPAHPVFVNLQPNYPPSGRIVGPQPTFAVADISNPILQPWAREELKKRNERILAGGTGYTRQVSCWPMGTPAFLLYPAQPLYVVQDQKEVLLIAQMDNQVRHVYLGVSHSKNVKPSWYGESIGHYEGDTLVVDTIGMNDKTFLDNYRTPHTEKLHVTERWRMIENGAKLEILLTIDDPDTFNQPFQEL